MMWKQFDISVLAVTEMEFALLYVYFLWSVSMKIQENLYLFKIC